MCCADTVACAVQIAGEKEYYLASAFEELYIAPTANVRLAGFSVAGERQRCLAPPARQQLAFLVQAQPAQSSNCQVPLGALPVCQSTPRLQAGFCDSPHVNLAPDA